MAQHYSIFLSYRHKPFDSAVTQNVFNVLESYRLPASLRRKGMSSVTRVFRDTEELPVSRLLTSTIQDALENSKCLVVVCSKDTPSSEWVDREVATFIELGRAEQIYPLLISGDPSTSFPPSLKKIPDIRNRVMDLRENPKGVSARAPGALLAVIAAVAGCPQSKLIRADRMRSASKSVLTATLSIVIVGALTLVAAISWLRAEGYRKVALREQERSMAVLSQLTYDLPNQLVEIPDTYAEVAQILDENVQQINRILELARQRDGIREQIAANYEKHATASVRLGRYETARESQQSAIEVYEQLVAENAPGATESLASAHNNLGVALNAAGQYDDAAKAYRSAAAILEPLCQDDPALNGDLAVFLSNIGANAMNMGDYEAAAPAFGRSVELLEALAEDGTEGLGGSLARARHNLGVSLMASGRYGDAEAWLTETVDWYKAQYDSVQNRTNLRSYAQSLSQLALCLSTQAKLEEAEKLFPTAIELLETLAAGGDDASATSLLANTYNNYGLCLNMGGDYAAAEPCYLQYAALYEQLYADAGTDLNRAGVARAYYNVAENAFKKGDYAAVRTYYRKCLDEYEPVHRTLGDYHASEYLARLAYYHIIVTKDYKKALTAAEEALALQPESSFVMIINAYALLFNRQYEACDALIDKAVSRSEGERLNIELDFAALKAAGLHEPHMDEILKSFD